MKHDSIFTGSILTSLTRKSLDWSSMEIDALSLPQTFSVSRLHSSLPPFTLTHGINALLRRRQRQLPWETVMNSCSHHTSTDAILLTADCWLLPAEERESCSSVNTIKQAPQLSFPPDQLSEVSSIAPLRDGVCSRIVWEVQRRLKIDLKRWQESIYAVVEPRT